MTLGDNGTIDGQGSVWWDWFSSHSLNYSRPHLVEFVNSESVLVSNLTFLNAPAYSIHPVYCRFVRLYHWLPSLCSLKYFTPVQSELEHLYGNECQWIQCSGVHVHSISVSTPLDSPHTNGIVPGMC